MSLAGKNVTLEILSPNFQTPTIVPQSRPVGATVEFPDISEFDILGDGILLLTASVDLTATTLTYTYTDAISGNFGDFIFNGIVVSDTDGTILPIEGVSVSSFGNSIGLTNDRILFNEDKVYLDFAGLSVVPNVGATVDLTFAPSQDTFSSTDEALYVARLYTASLGRDPDSGGLNFWIDNFEFLQTKQKLAQAFIVSPEFEDRFGSLADLGSAGFVDRLYENVLGREGEPGGRAFWINAIDNGTLNERTVLVAFVDSPENIANTQDFETVAQNAGTGNWDFIV